MHQNTLSNAAVSSDLKNSLAPADLLIRYAKGRIGYFSSRQVLTLCGSFLLLLIDGPWVAILVLLVATLGETVDCLYLRRVPGLLNRQVPVRHIYVCSTVTAVFQALTISICIAIVWSGGASHDAPLLSMAFLAGASINATLAMPFHRAATLGRLIVYGATSLLFFLSEITIHTHIDTILALNAAGAAIMAYCVYAFMGFVNLSFQRSNANVQSLLEQSRILERTNTDLQASQKEAQKLSLVAKNANDSVILSDDNGQILWTNDAFSRITGFSATEARGKTVGDLLNGPGTSVETIELIRAAISKGQEFRGEIQNITKDGRQIWIETNLVPVVDHEGEVEIIISIERDITAQRHHAAELEVARRSAEEGARAKAEFLATMSHEIRTPMNGIIGMTDLLCDTKLSPSQSECAHTIRSSAEALLTIVNDVLDLSKLDAKKMSLNPVDFDLHACLKDAVKLLQHQALEKGLSLDLNLLATLPRMAHADAGRLRQVLINLIGNAVKFTDRGSIVIRAGSHHNQGSEVLTIEVQDTGIGIAPQDLGRVFERFSQADAATTRQFDGTGLGLTISRLLAHAMGGEIIVTSELGRGSCFTLTILTQSIDTSVGAPGQMQEIDDNNLNRLNGVRVLIAEDNRINRLLISKYLSPTPVEFSFALDGQQAIAENEAKRPDIVFMDMSMPVMNGLQATQHIRTNSSWQPKIVALTANAFASDKSACLQAGMDGFLSKPLRKIDLLACLIQHAKPCQPRPRP